MNKNTKIILFVIILLITILALSLFINKNNILKSRELNRNATFSIMNNGKEITSYNMDAIREMEEISFTATLNTSTSKPKNHEYTGVLLKNLFIHAGIDLTEYDAVTITGADGYTVAISTDKVLEDNNVYLVYMIEDTPLGTKEEGGSGPYQTIIRKDQFSQYWCKYAIYADVR